MPDPRLPRGALLRLGILAAIALLLLAPRLAPAAGRSPLSRPSGAFVAKASRPRDPIAEADRWIGSGNMTGLPGPWCAWFASFVLTRTGHRPLASGLASSALFYGPRLSSPRAGALAVLAGHVGFVEGVEPDGSIRLVSGNWSHRVTRSVVARWKVLAFVDPE